MQAVQTCRQRSYNHSQQLAQTSRWSSAITLHEICRYCPCTMLPHKRGDVRCSVGGRASCTNCRSHATLEAHAKISQSGPSGGSDAANTFLSGLHFEAKKGFQNFQVHAQRPLYRVAPSSGMSMTGTALLLYGRAHSCACTGEGKICRLCSTPYKTSSVQHRFRAPI